MRFLGVDASRRPDEIEAHLMAAVNAQIVREHDRMERELSGA